jgi:molybdate transport system ATP-binding protein
MSALFEAELEHRLRGFRLQATLALEREIGVLFGPSGAGKSLTLRLLSGSERPTRGRIRLGERVLLQAPGGPSVPSRRRRIGLVHQSLSLFPHLSVLENVAYGIREKRPVRERLAGHWIERLHLAGLEGRYPGQLSGGQQQRVALARAMAGQPELLLLDEPFSALDAPLRRSLRRELRTLQRQTGIPMLYVSHQIEDVCALGVRIVLIREGRTGMSFPVQRLWAAGSQAEAWPALGWGTLVRGRVEERSGGLWLCWERGALELPPAAAVPGPAAAFVAPQEVKILYPGLPVDPQLAANRLEGKVEEAFALGSTRTLHVSAAGLSWHVEHPVDSYRDLDLGEGAPVAISVPPASLTVLAGGGNRQVPGGEDADMPPQPAARSPKGRRANAAAAAPAEEGRGS